MTKPEADPDMPGDNQCPQCGTALPANVLEGLCLACLLKQGVAPDTAMQPELPSFEPPTVEVVARLFPQLEILELIGKGGMGAVYKARQPALDRFVALKVLPVAIAAGPRFAERFNRAARALARLSHPNIVTVHEFGQAGDLHYFIMEYLDGVNLRQLQQTSRLSPREALQIVPQICGALQYAHDEGVVHRDIKPENVHAARVLIVADGAVWIWRLAEDRLAEADQRLDLYHAIQHLWTVAHERHGAGRAEAAAWVKPFVRPLEKGQAQRVITQLEQVLEPFPQDQRPVVERELNYFQSYQDRMDYGAAQQRGEPLGSGGMESTCRQDHCRFKRTGQYWSTRGDEALMTLETFWRNGRWNQLYPHVGDFDPARN